MSKKETEKRRERGTKEEWMTGNDIGDEGAKAMSGALKVNITLIWLNLRGEE